MTRIRTSNRDLTWIVAIAVGLGVYLVGCHFAHAAPGTDPATELSSGGDAAANILAKDGPWWLAIAVVNVALRQFLDHQHRLRQGRLLSGLSSLSGVVAAVAAWHWQSAPTAGIVTALIAGFTLLLHPAPPAQIPTNLPRASIVSVLALIALGGALAIGCDACSGSKSPGTIVVDCTGGSGTGIVANVLATLDAWSKPEPDGCRLDTGFDWKCIESSALAKGEQIGGCALAEFVQGFLGGTKAPAVDDSWLARAALENARGHWGGTVTWRTAKGDL